MRAVRLSLIAAIVFSLSSASQAHAGSGLFGCLGNEKITIPAITSPFITTTQPIVIGPASSQSSPAQSGLSDTLTNALVNAIINNLLQGRGSNPTPNVNTGGSTTTSATLDRIDGKLDNLEQLILDRLTKVESDVATVAKAQRESTAQLEQRLVETTNLVKNNADAINTNTKAILRTQQETAGLISIAQTPSTISSIKLTAVVNVTPLTSGYGNSITIGTDVFVLFHLNDQDNTDLAMVRWNANGKDNFGTAKFGDLK